ncbi:MAG TPA: hypothetical protein VMF13_22840 [Luteitalea sp.]|nr:hypothetical protein [Luteitalea sp.]
MMAGPVAAMHALAQPLLIDRLVAVVGEQALTWRDVEAARLLGSIPPGGTEAEGIDRLLTRELMRLEVERLAVPIPIEPAIDERLSRAVQRIGSSEAWARALQALGFTEVDARAWVADDIRIDVYVDQRFTAAAQPTDVEVSQEAGTPGGRPPTPEQLLEARRRLTTTRRSTLVADWLAGIRARTSMQIAGPR